MAHQSLYLKYRPARFEDVVGQNHIVRTLRNALAEGTVSHAYLFTGPRGTGKTTTARILAKAMLCEKGPTPEPDDGCAQCAEIAEGRHPDVYELDAASRTGVDDVREEIIGRVAFAPSRGRVKLYIIDEVHMLSKSAFNALLKTIEEPPSHVYFILCTTDPAKVPETIQSRCQRFDFHRIGMEDLVARLARIADSEGIEVAESSLTLMARHALGGMRNAISTLEQLAAFTGKRIEMADVESLLGEVDAALLYEFAAVVARREVGEGFRFVARLVGSGVDALEFARELVAHFRDLYVVAVAGDGRGIVDATEEEIARLASQAREFGPDRLARALDVLAELTSEMRWSSDPRLALEVALTRLARPEADLTVESLAERLEVLEASVAAGGLPSDGTPAPSRTEARPPASPKAPSGDTPARPSAEAPTPAVTEMRVVRPSGPLDRAAVKRAWPAVLQEMRKVKVSRAQLFVSTEVDVDSDGSTLVVEFPSDAAFTMERAKDPGTLQVLRRALATVIGGSPPVRFQLGRGRVRDEGRPPAAPPRRNDVPPATSPDETGGIPVIRPEPSSGGGPDLERIIDDLGAEVVAHEHDDT